ncbi:hypothetical protein D3C76_376930 [compost metagenome]
MNRSTGPQIAVYALNLLHIESKLGVGVNSLLQNQRTVYTHGNILVRIHPVHDQDYRLARGSERYALFNI